jgi:hypothetical protein
METVKRKVDQNKNTGKKVCVFLLSSKTHTERDVVAVWSAIGAVHSVNACTSQERFFARSEKYTNTTICTFIAIAYTNHPRVLRPYAFRKGNKSKANEWEALEVPYQLNEISLSLSLTPQQHEKFLKKGKKRREEKLVDFSPTTSLFLFLSLSHSSSFSFRMVFYDFCFHRFSPQKKKHTPSLHHNFASSSLSLNCVFMIHTYNFHFYFIFHKMLLFSVASISERMRDWREDKGKGDGKIA